MKNKNNNIQEVHKNGLTSKNIKKEEEYVPHKHEKLVYTENQVGGHPGTIIDLHDKILKKAKESEFEMYQFLYSEKCPEDLQELKTYLPKYLGTEEINGEDFIILENLHLGFEFPNIVDCKIGRITWTENANLKKIEVQREKNLKSINAYFGFRITGLIIRDKAGKLLEQIKKPIVETFITKENLFEYLTKLVSYDGIFQINLVHDIIDQTQNILQFFKRQTKSKFVASSIYYVIGKNNKVQARFIDIAHPEDSKGNLDENVIDGIEGLINVWKSLLN